MKKPNKPTGGRALKSLIESGLPMRGGVWIDTYNQIYNIKHSGTITTRVDGACMYFVTQAIEND